MKRNTNRTIGGKAKIERVTADGEPVVRVTFGHWSAVGIFLIVWITGWSFGCYKLVSDLVSKPFNVGEALFALPFFAGEIFVAWMILLMIFGRTVFTFRREGGTKFTGVGSIGFTKEFSFPIKGELCTDEEVRHGSKGGTYTVYRFIVKTQFDLDGPRVIYDSTDGDIVYALCEAAKEIAVTAGAPKLEEKNADEIADEEAGIERLDYELLAGRPPKGMSVSRDFEGRIFVVLRRVRWMMAVVLLAAMAFFTWLNWFKFTDVPIPVKIGFVFVMLFPFVLFLSALFGKRTMTLDHGNGTTFFGVGPLGLRRRFEYGGAFNVKVAESALWVNNERMNELVIAKPDGTQQKICASWPNDVKPYLAAFLRHPGSAAVDMAAK